MRQIDRRAWGVLVTAAALVVTAMPAQAAGDVTPPTLKAPIKASFTVGQQIPLGSPPDCGGDPGDLWLDVAETFSWKGSDAGGAVRYSLVQNTGAYGPEEVFSGSTQTSYAGVGTSSSQACGGGNHSVYQWDLTAVDPAGNEVTRVVTGGQIKLTQEDNLSSSQYNLTQPTLSFAGAWGSSSCACWSNGRDRKSTSAGASATATVTVAAGGATHLGLVMAKGPDRGRFSVSVDGVAKGTVDTYAATSRPRSVVWQVALTGGTHRVTLVNLATAGRPRIDLDAVLTN